MERSELRRSIMDYLKAHGGSAAPPFAFARHALVEDALESLATEGFIEKRIGGSYHLTDKGRDYT
jgi:hypothetical protein